MKLRPDAPPLARSSTSQKPAAAPVEDELFVTLRQERKPNATRDALDAPVATQATPAASPLPGPTPLTVPAELTPMSALPTNTLSGVELAAQARVPLQQLIAEHPYSTMGCADQFFRHLDAVHASNPQATMADILGTFQSDSRRDLDTYGSGHCVGMSDRLVEALAEEHIEAFAAPVELTAGLRPPGGPPFGHEAVFAPFKGGVVLLDPGLSLSEPVIIKEGGTAELTRGHTTYRYTWESRPDGTADIKSEQIDPPAHGEFATYRLARIENMDASCARALAIRDHQFRIAGHTADAHLTAQLTVQPESREVALSVGNKRLEVSYDELQTLEPALTPEVAELLATTPEALKSLLHNFVTHADELVEARAYLEAHPA